MRHGEKHGSDPDRGQGPQNSGRQRRNPAQPGGIGADRTQCSARGSAEFRAESEPPIPDRSRQRRNRLRHCVSLAHQQPSGAQPARLQQPHASQCRRCQSRGQPRHGLAWAAETERRQSSAPAPRARPRTPAHPAARSPPGAPKHAPPALQRPPTPVRPAVGLLQTPRRREPSWRVLNRRCHGATAEAAGAGQCDRHWMGPRPSSSRETEASRASPPAALPASGRRIRRPAISTTGAMPARPAAPLPPSERMSTVSA